MAQAWFVAQVKSGDERKAKVELAKAGFPVVALEYEVVTRHARQMALRAYPLFPGYVFVSFDDDARSGQATKVRRTEGVFGLMGMRALDGGRLASPAKVPDKVIRDLSAACVMGAFNRLGAIGCGLSDFMPGDNVKLIGGALEGMVGKIRAADDAARIEVLIDMFGGATKAVVGVDNLARIA